MAFRLSPGVTDVFGDRPKHNPGDTIYRIIMIPGNPGLISFYKTFLQELATLLKSVSGASFVIEGHSLGGFEVAGPPPLGHDRPLGLQEQIDYVEQMIDRSVARDQGKESQSDKVILIGHSVGAYILLEVLRRHTARRKDREVPYRIVGGIGLFPTVVNIAQSKSGRRVTPVLNLAYFPIVASFIATIVIRLTLHELLWKLVKWITGFPDHAVNCVTGYLQSPLGVRQTLHMAKDEMNEITADRWDEEIWGSATASQEERCKLFFYFGKDDHWVADRTRDDLMDTRAFQQGTDEAWKPKMEVDTQGTTHGFCVRKSLVVQGITTSGSANFLKGDEESELVAQKCAQYVKEIVAVTSK